METITINGCELEYVDETHTYLYEGVILPSVTRILSVKFGNKYDKIPKAILELAARQGTAVHKAIEDYEVQGIESDCPELQNYKRLKEEYGFECIDNEVPVVLFRNGEAVACGRLDLVLTDGEKVGLGDVKRTYKLDEQYLAYQLNHYRIAYQQCYGKEISFLRGLHLRENISRYIDIPIDESLVNETLDLYFKERMMTY